MIRPSVWSTYFYELSMPDKIAAFTENCFWCSELSDEDGHAMLEQHGSPAAAGAYLKKLCDDTGFAFPQGHLWLQARITDADYMEKIDILKKWLDMYLEAGIHRAVLHGGSRAGAPDTYGKPTAELSYEEMKHRRMTVLGALLDHVKGTPLVICMENLYKTDLDTSAGLMALMREANHENLGICLDTGHLNLTGEPQIDFLRACGSYVKALHITDNEGERDQHIIPFGKGTVDFFSVVRGLREIGYDGLFNYEIPGDRHAPDQILRYKLRYLHSVTDYLFKNA
ncbi:MAG: sugar phosphate isomerase/epimerase [Clostridia bacterium]|nr:sugar phosphate isomerase/epimerase [Oscillospiraceae bacterium]MBR6748451.1 sugar phosphate isomerase/epimerase [Clostridia bacterium]